MGDESPKPASTPKGAVFLSYASQDAEAAVRICEALRAAGVEVWLDQSELRGGDAWDESIRDQIKACALFIPVISANAHARVEGYFRLEWKLAIDRSHRIASKQPFLFPVVIDDTPQTDDAIPERFRELHWTRLPHGQVMPAFVERVQRVVSPPVPADHLGARIDPGAHSTQDQSTAVTTGRAKPYWSRAKFLAAAVVIIAGGAYLAVDRFVHVPATPAAPRASIAVVPFVNLTGDPSKEYFSDGMAEELIGALAQVPGLKVPARTSSFAYKGRNTDIRRIAQDLGVGTILEGSVRSAGERIRVTAQLVDAASGYHLWSQSYDRQFADIFKLQDELAAAIIQALRGSVPMPERAERAPPTQDVEAYQLYLQARGTMRYTESGYRAALALYDQAIARDPHFAQALAGRAQSRYSSLTLGLTQPNALEFEESEHDARQALALDASLPLAHLALASRSMFRGNWLEAEAEFRRALSAHPLDARILALYAGQLATVGHLHEAHVRASEAYGLAPADPVTVYQCALVASLMGLDAEATRLADLVATLGIPPSAPLMPQFYVNAALRSGHYEEAANRAAEATAPELREVGGAEAIRLAYLTMGDEKRVAAAVEGLQRLVRDHSDRLDALPKGLLIVVFARLGALDQAFDFANHTLDDYLRAGWNGGGRWGGLWVPEMRAFRKDPRFQQFVARLKLPDYWKQFGPPDECDLKGDTLLCR